MTHPVHVAFPGRILIVGFGSIGQGVLPLILRHIGIKPERITIVTAEERGQEEAAKLGVKFVVEPLVRENFRRVLDPLLGRGDFLLNVSVDVSSLALVKLCWEKGAMYLDTCIEPWIGGYTDPGVPGRAPHELRAARRGAGAARAESEGADGGDDARREPGLVSHLVKQALLNLAGDLGIDPGSPKSRDEWAQLARKAGVKVVHIAERDTQVTDQPKKLNEFVNTWSVDGFVSEGQQPAELGWGAHERNFPRDGKRFDFGGGSAIYLTQPGAPRACARGRRRPAISTAS